MAGVGDLLLMTNLYPGLDRVADGHLGRPQLRRLP
jgi:hypothetical protein